MDPSKLPVTGAIFDMDGTILDSSPMWDTIAEDVLMYWGYTPKPSIREDVHPLGALDMAPFLKNDYHMTQTEEEINGQINSRIGHYYNNEAQLKPGALELLKTLKAAGIKLALLTATSLRFGEPAMRLTGAWELFDVAVSCEELGRTKSDPEPFREVLRRLGTDIADTWVFEDALYAISTAKKMGFQVCAIADSAAAYQWEEVKAASDCHMEAFSQWPERLLFADQLKKE